MARLLHGPSNTLQRRVLFLRKEGSDLPVQIRHQSIATTISKRFPQLSAPAGLDGSKTILSNGEVSWFRRERRLRDTGVVSCPPFNDTRDDRSTIMPKNPRGEKVAYCIAFKFETMIKKRGSEIDSTKNTRGRGDFKSPNGVCLAPCRIKMKRLSWSDLDLYV